MMKKKKSMKDTEKTKKGIISDREHFTGGMARREVEGSRTDRKHTLCQPLPLKFGVLWGLAAQLPLRQSPLHAGQRAARGEAVPAD